MNTVIGIVFLIIMVIEIDIIYHTIKSKRELSVSSFRNRICISSFTACFALVLSLLILKK